MDKYINRLFLQLNQKYKVSILIIMNYSEMYNCISRMYKLTINKKTPNSKLPKEKVIIDIRGKK